MAFAKLGDGDKASELFSLLNPINHARTPRRRQRYKVEPYVVAADVYSVPPHVGRGGWTWYTGSAGWMYRAGVEGILGIRREGAVLVDPCIPAAWPGFEARIELGSTQYDIRVDNHVELLSRRLASAPRRRADVLRRRTCSRRSGRACASAADRHIGRVEENVLRDSEIFISHGSSNRAHKKTNSTLSADVKHF